jgi:osmotically-inducible protein OsmY
VFKSLKRITSPAGALALAALLAAGGAACRKGDNANAGGANANRAGGANTVVTAPTPATASQDTALRNTVEANLTRNGVSGVTVSVANGRVTLRGNVARAKLQDAMKAANDANPPGGVDNQMNIQ